MTERCHPPSSLDDDLFLIIVIHSFSLLFKFHPCFVFVVVFLFLSLVTVTVVALPLWRTLPTTRRLPLIVRVGGNLNFLVGLDKS